MKTARYLFALFAVVSVGCDSDTRLEADIRTTEIDADDVAWATGWSVFKWRLGALTDKPVHSIQIVVAGENGELVHEAGSVGYDELLDPDGYVTIAFKKDGSTVSVRLRYGGASINTELKEVFGDTNWGTSSGWRVSGDLLAVATDARLLPHTTEALLKIPGNKLCLRLITRISNEAEQDEARESR